MKGLLSLKDITTEQIREIVNLSLDFKKGKSVNYFGKKMVTLFFENSTRTNYSFISAMINMNITPVQFNAELSSVNKGETLYDTVKTFEALGFDGAVIRHSKERFYDELSTINMPIFNGGDGASDHPTQNLLDLVTIYEEFEHFEGLNVCIVGDIAHSRVAHSGAEVMKRLGMNVFMSGPKEFMDDTCSYIPLEDAIKNMDVIMLLRVQFERHADKMNITKEEYHNTFGLTLDKVAKMKENAIIMHPAPINRGIEIADDVAECFKARIVKQMTNGVFARQAVIHMTLEGLL